MDISEVFVALISHFVSNMATSRFKIGVLIADNLLNYVSLTNIHCDAKKLKINLIFLLCYQYLPHVNYRFQYVRLPLSKCR